jgi:uncharacterized metal-binding protein YceD (DUF177 family)
MNAAPVISQRLRISRLHRNRVHPVRIVPDADELGKLADRLGLTNLRKLRFEGELSPVDGGWALAARLGATVVQPCRVTTDPVTSRIEEEVARRWLEGWEPSDNADEETLDDGTEGLPETLDLGLVLEEELALALPPFPRAPGVDDVDLEAVPPGAEPLDEGARRPFAGLAALRDRMGDGGSDDGAG